MNKLATKVSIITTHPIWILFWTLLLAGVIYVNYEITLADVFFGGIFTLCAISLSELLKRKFKLEKKDRTDRSLFLIILLIFFSIFSLISLTFVSQYFKEGLVISLIILSVIWVNNYFYRISMHVGLNTSFLILINHLNDWKFIWAFIIIPIIAWSRLVLKKHTVFQLIMGFCVPSLIYLILYLTLFS